MAASIVFDLDGTLVDSVADMADAVNETLGEQGAEPLDVATVQGFVGDGLPKLVERVIGHSQLDMADHTRLTQVILQRYTETPLQKTSVYPGLPAALAALRDIGCTMGICTNKATLPARHVLDALDLSRFFDVVICGDTLPSRKPDPAPLLAAFEALPIGPRVFVGDSEVDAETARRAAIPFFLFTEGYRKSPLSKIPHTASYSDAGDLPELIRTQVDLPA